MVYVEHGDGGDSSAKGSETKDKHRGGVGGVSLIGLTYEHGDDSTSKVLDEENH